MQRDKTKINTYSRPSEGEALFSDLDTGYQTLRRISERLPLLEFTVSLRDEVAAEEGRQTIKPSVARIWVKCCLPRSTDLHKMCAQQKRVREEKGVGEKEEEAVRASACSVEEICRLCIGFVNTTTHGEFRVL